MENTTTITEILDSFKNFDGNYKREQVDAAIELKKEITPHLIEILKNVLADPDSYIENEELYDHIYSIMLLGYFRESRAHDVIIDLFCLPDELPHEIFGDLATSDLPVLLLQTCGGSIERIKSMALNRDVDVYCRISALQAMAYAVVENIVSREEVVKFFGTLFTGKEADPDSDFWGLLANLVCSLYPEELMSIIEKAYDDDLIASEMISYENFESVLEDGKEWCLERLRSDLERHSLGDMHDGMSWWACFDEEPQFYSAQEPDDLISYAQTTHSDTSNQKLKKKKEKAKKKKRKQAKASRKKNRR